MTRANEDVPEAELAVLQTLWDRGELTRQQLSDLLYPDRGTAGYTTVQQLLKRLVDRGLVLQGGTARPRTFTAALSRDDWLGRRLGQLADRVCGGSLAPLVLNLVKVRPLTATELAELRAFLRQQGRPHPDGAE